MPVDTSLLSQGVPTCWQLALHQLLLCCGVLCPLVFAHNTGWTLTMKSMWRCSCFACAGLAAAGAQQLL